MSKQPEALRLADQLRERFGATVPTSQAASLLRSQHALIGELVEALEKFIRVDADYTQLAMMELRPEQHEEHMNRIDEEADKALRNARLVIYYAKEQQ